MDKKKCVYAKKCGLAGDYQGIDYKAEAGQKTGIHQEAFKTGLPCGTDYSNEIFSLQAQGSCGIRLHETGADSFRSIQKEFA